MAAMVVHTRLPSLDDLSPQRRSTTVAALRRGHIKISEPVLLENSGPSPVWNSPATRSTEANGPVTPLVTEGNVGVVNSPLHQLADVKEASLHSETTSQQMSSSTDLRADPFNPPKTSHGQPLRHRRSSLFRRDSDSGNLSVRPGTSSQVASSTHESVSDNNMSPQNRKKRRSGSIRLAFRKIFSGKKEKTDEESSPPRTKGRGHEYHKSESAILTPLSRNALGNVAEERNISPRHVQKRAEPEDEYLAHSQINTPKLPFPMNINAPQPSPYNTPHKSNIQRTAQDEITESPTSRRRRATLPSIVLSPAEADSLAKQWEAEKESADAQQYRQSPSPMIGLAITSNSSSMSNRSQKRRSRSADALHDMAVQQGALDVRRRSAEIHYWRTTNHGIPEAEEREDEMQESTATSIKEVAEIIVAPPSISNTSITVASHPSRHTEIEAASTSSQSMIEPTSARGSNEVEAMNRVDLRLSQIEMNMAQLAHSMQALSERDKPRSFKLDKAPQRTSARMLSVDRPQYYQPPHQQQQHIPQQYPSANQFAAQAQAQAQAAQQQQQQQQRHGLPSNPRDANMLGRATSLRSPTSPKPRHPRPSPSESQLPTQQELASPPTGPLPAIATALSHDPSSPRQSQQANPFAPSTNRVESIPPTPHTAIHNFSQPFSTSSTNLPAHTHQQPSPSDSPTKLIDHLAPLYNALRYERSERKRLEAQVLQLQHDLLDLTTIIAQRLGIAATYPTPSPDMGMGSSHLRGMSAGIKGFEGEEEEEHGLEGEWGRQEGGEMF